MKRVLTAAWLGLLLLGTAAHAEELPWYHKPLVVEDPDRLGYFLFVGSECGLTESSVSKAVEGVLIRGRLVPMKNSWSSPEGLWLQISVTCLDRGAGTTTVFASDVSYGFKARGADVKVAFEYGKTGIGRPSFILNSLKGSVENAITDFIKVNMSKTLTSTSR